MVPSRSPVTGMSVSAACGLAMCQASDGTHMDILQNLPYPRLPETPSTKHHLERFLICARYAPPTQNRSLQMLMMPSMRRNNKETQKRINLYIYMYIYIYSI